MLAKAKAIMKTAGIVPHEYVLIGGMIVSVLFLMACLALSVPVASLQKTAVVAAASTIDFNDRSPNASLNGQYPAGIADWGTGRWWLSGPWRKFTTNNISFNTITSTSESFTFINPTFLVSLEAFNGGTITSTITLSCTGNPSVTVVLAADEQQTIATNWSSTCTLVVMASSNGGWTNFDNIVYDTAITPTPSVESTPTPSLTPTSSPTPTPTPANQILVFHPIQVDQNGGILPWYSADPGESYDHVIQLVWNYWRNMETCSNGVKRYLQHRISVAHTGIGGDQLAMALSSWQLLYQYSGDPSVLDDMVSIADFYLDHGLSSSTALWPQLPFPYNGNGDVPLGPDFFNGDYVGGAGVTQPDKAGSFAAELITLYKMTGNQRYLTAAINIANTLAAKVVPGDSDNSPWPFRVNVNTGEVVASYTANWTGTLRLFDDLIKLNQGNTAGYLSARATLSTWLKTYPLHTNRWGPFFEDVGVWSNTETNADTFAGYLLEHPAWDANWQNDARNILDWTTATFGNNTWANVTWSDYGVLPINEQTEYMMPGNSHTARHGSVELIYAAKTGDTSRKAGAIRQLNWATYMVDFDGANQYPTDLIWLTDGYGDYVRHYLRAMAAAPELAPSNHNHLLSSSSVVTTIAYEPTRVRYSTFDKSATEVLKVTFEPRLVVAGGLALPRRQDLAQEGWVYDSSTQVLRIRHDSAKSILIARGSVLFVPFVARGR